MSSSMIDASFIKNALNRFPHKIQRMGQQNFQEGRVLEIVEVKAGLEYAARVEGNFVYDVVLSFGGDTWKTRCSCPIMEDCKHAFAALVHLSVKGAGNGNSRVARSGDDLEVRLKW